jgi:hypothetical protein
MAVTRAPTGWNFPVVLAPTQSGAPIDQALVAAVKLSGSMVSVLRHPKDPLWFVFGDERMASVEPTRGGGFTARAAAYPPAGMPAFYAQLEAEGWEDAG